MRATFKPARVQTPPEAPLLCGRPFWIDAGAGRTDAAGELDRSGPACWRQGRRQMRSLRALGEWLCFIFLYSFSLFCYVNQYGGTFVLRF